VISPGLAILIVEDDVSTRERLIALLTSEPGYAPILAAATLAEGRAALAELPDEAAMLVDLGLPDGSGVELIRDGRRRQPPVESLVISVLGDEHSVLTAIEAGAGGYLLKDAEAVGIVAAVEQLRAGGAPLSPAIAVHLMRRLQPKRTQAPLLSARELELLKLIAKGLTYEEVAGVLGLRYNTVASYAKDLYRKLEVHSRSEAVFEAVQLGLVRRA
jgi:DNA-binding NarL/FixJ family response regulator